MEHDELYAGSVAEVIGVQEVKRKFANVFSSRARLCCGCMGLTGF